ncbi:MAG TPA: MipA/OmpV family protein [Gemmatimonadaceae bacterium]|nr:MipA/OmpV family protein [Gemmatimonadaceae bacterium]
MTATTFTASRPTTRLALLALHAWTVALLALPAHPLAAQDSTGRERNWHGSVGMAAGSIASYYGSDARRTLGAPVIDLAFRQRLLIRTTTANGALGAGIQWIVKDGALGASVGLAAAESRQEDRANGLAGMDNRSGSVFGTTSLFLRAGPAVAMSTTMIGLDGDAGNMQLLGLQLGGPIAPRLFAGIGSTVTWADHRNMAFDFGITPEQAERRRELLDAGDGRLRDGDAIAFAPHAGFKELRNTAQLGYSIYGAWQVVGVVSDGHLAHGVAESPLARKSSATTTALGFVYRF